MKVNDKYMKYVVLVKQNIAYYRKKRHLTQKGLALKINISEGYLSQIEAPNMDKLPAFEIFFSICDALNTEPYKMFLEPEELYKVNPK